MGDLHGYWGKLTRINLSTRDVTYEDIPDDVIEKFLGAKGLAAYYICGELDVGMSPFSSDNEVALTVGPFQGTAVPSTGRFCTAAISPMTGMFLDTYAGGNFGHSLKKSGFDVVIVEGVSDHPAYITIENEEAHVKDARDLWGLETDTAEQELRSMEGEGSHCVTIGPAGENLVLFSCLISDTRRASGRGGLGAVFGSKRLKAIVAKGSLKVPVNDPKKLKEVVREFNASVRKEKEEGRPFYKYGTTGILETASERDRLPTRNYQEAQFERASDISGEAIYEKYDVKTVPCCPCPIACPATLDGKYDRPEYETLAMLGSNTGNKDLQAIVDANTLCNRLGLDTISTGGVLGFAMECSQKGIVEGDIEFGKPEQLRELIRKIAYKEGIGDLLANGVRKASEELGKEAERIAVQVKGLEIPAWDPRGKLGHGLAYMTADIGGSHLRDFYSERGIPDESALDVVEKVIDGQNFTVQRDNYIICAFATDKMTSDMRMRAYEAITGSPMTAQRLSEISERVWTLIRAFSVREGTTRAQDILPHRFLREALPTGVAKGCTAFVSDEDMNLVLDKYYEMRGWDSNGVPLQETLDKLGI